MTDSPSASASYIEWLVRTCRDSRDRARLKRTLRADDTIDAAAWWILGAWLPEAHDRALIRARIAGLYASHGNGPGITARNLGGELSLAPDIKEDTAERLLESMTDPGAGTVSRVGHLVRVLPRCTQGGARIDWAQLCDDLHGLASPNRKWQRAIRSRWYRQYHNLKPSDRKEPL